MQPGQLLILDDDALVGAFVKRVGESMGLAVCLTSSPRAFYAAYARLDPSDIVLDLRLGDGDGVEILRRLAAQRCRARITLLSGLGGRMLSSAKELGVGLGLNLGETLVKPVRIATLRAALEPPTLPSPPPTAPELAAAIRDGALRLEYQPIVDCASGEVRCVEALVRWKRTTGELIAPDRFIPLAEADPVLMDALTLDVARRVAADWRTIGRCGHDLGVALNVSTQNLHNLDLPERLEAIFEPAGLPLERVTLEITETAAMSDPLVSLDILLRLRIKGFNLAVDDFGTGYTSPAMLRRLPYAELKIDRSLVQDVATSPDAQAVVRTTVALAASLDLKTVAEGVECADALGQLAKLGVTAAQGYLISRPLALDRLCRWLTDPRSGQRHPHYGQLFAALSNPI
jgi:EAL domain-containing protein (putative c-di-GMP-specific phosphodiesterase class I)/ActR/RegA family two-component response regulator